MDQGAGTEDGERALAARARKIQHPKPQTPRKLQIPSSANVGGALCAPTLRLVGRDAVESRFFNLLGLERFRDRKLVQIAWVPSRYRW